ncbi:hypothetical protein JR316_0007296 [Psilocybe cubensis]|uniref:Uncharacterized protein n=1 Tax=Psilocybe cubensis TaxID=181762 RepID=A0ACB8GYJ9_PSICU|nr:hypothetical protein JR316_0007296 [Psilocybe cubensis]KAH9480696.1 hypothetical protein JR316_0007296 [Psilocybe cubensis]
MQPGPTASERHLALKDSHGNTRKSTNRKRSFWDASDEVHGMSIGTSLTVGFLSDSAVRSLRPRVPSEAFLTSILILANCFSLFSFLHKMFKWGKSKRDSKTSIASSRYEPKTPKLTSVSLPDGRYTPIDFQESTEKPISNLLFRHFSPDRRPDVSVSRSRRTPVDTSRARVSSSGHVEAPRPIRPHPSQGAYLPILDHRDRDVIDPTRKPISVPSAQYLEAQIRNLPPTPAVAHNTRQLLNADVDYPEEKRLKEIAKRNGDVVNRDLLKTYPDPKNQKNSSTPALKNESSKRSKVPVDFENWKGVPVSTTPVIPFPENNGKGPLKSALKKSTATTPPIKPTTAPIKSAMKKESSYDTGKSYYSEDEYSRRKDVTPSKAWLEVQHEKRQDEERARRSSTSRVPPPVVVDHPAVYGPNAFPSSNSTTPSPTEMGHDYHRRRRASQSSEPAIFNSRNYLPAYIRERVEQQARQDKKDFWDRVEKFGKGTPTHPQLEWPLVDYSIRMWRTPATPRIYFDAGFNPRIPKYAPRVDRGLYMSPMTREEETMEISYDAAVYKISLVNRTLSNWKIDMHFKYHIRVIDVFRAIYDTFSQPLTRQEYESLGEDVIKECFPAFKQRCMDIPEFAHAEERKGFLRIDLLKGRRVFKGLVPIPNKPNTFEILFDDGR